MSVYMYIAITFITWMKLNANALHFQHNLNAKQQKEIQIKNKYIQQTSSGSRKVEKGLQ